MNYRLQNKDFKTFINSTQFMVFSNNQDYEDGVIEPLFGAFYGTIARKKMSLNYFREEEILPSPPQVSSNMEDSVLQDNNCQIIKINAEFNQNKQLTTPTNKILTSLFTKQRLSFLLRHGITYITSLSDNTTVEQKHIMRYPQIFATNAITKFLDNTNNKGIIWHTQGSGKTALAYYNVDTIRKYYAKKGIAPKFYFVVDRIDLAEQAQRELVMRGLNVRIVESKADFAEEIKQTDFSHKSTEIIDIRIVNIQKFNDDEAIKYENAYNRNIQNVFFLDEVHRSYSDTGSNLGNLVNADKDAVIIGLTGTPLIGKDKKTKDMFGDYIHKYYYNASIADGYTLRIIREDIETQYKEHLRQQIAEIEVEKGSIPKSDIFEHPKFVKAMLEYIIKDFTLHRLRDDDSIGGMVVCQSAEQARKLYDEFNKWQYTEAVGTEPKTASLILHDVGSKSERKIDVEKFKAGKIDLLFVYNILLTGFDAPRLKKLYLTRSIKAHNLLQTLTRVNRPYTKNNYGYVVDFADISDEFKKTNEAYWAELQDDFGDTLDGFDDFFKSEDEIKLELQSAKEILWEYDTLNLEQFQSQINQIHDKEKLSPIHKALITIKELYNACRSAGQDEIIKNLNLNFETMSKYKKLLSMVSNRHNSLKLSDIINSTEQDFLKYAIEDMEFSFHKTGQEELRIVDEYRQKANRTREEFNKNINPANPEFVNLREELRSLLAREDFNNMSFTNIEHINSELDKLYDKIRELNRQDLLLCQKYNNDSKFVRIHKYIEQENYIPSAGQIELHQNLMAIKKNIDEMVSNNEHTIESSGFFKREVDSNVAIIFGSSIKVEQSIDFITDFIVKEYESSNLSKVR